MGAVYDLLHRTCVRLGDMCGPVPCPLLLVAKLWLRVELGSMGSGWGVGWDGRVREGTGVPS